MENLKKIIIFNLILIFCLTAFLKVKASESANTQLSMAITGRSLSVTAPKIATFTGKDFSFDGQTSSGNSIGDIQVEDARGTKVGWNVNISATDWSDGSHTMAYDGNGTTTGQLSLNIPEISAVTKLAGADVTGITMGNDDSFDGSFSDIKLLTAASGAGSGEYNIKGLTADQFIPGNQNAGTYSTDLTLTIS